MGNDIAAEMPHTSGVYKITCMSNNKVYVGSSIDMFQRTKGHVALLRYNKHCNKHLQFAWNKYGESAFRFDVIELVLSFCVQFREQYWINKLKASNHRKGFNMNPIASGAHYATLETREKIGNASKERVFTQQHRARIAASNSGRRRSDESKAKIRNARARQVISEESKQKRSETLKGKIRPDDVRLRISESHRARNLYASTVLSPDGTSHCVDNLRDFCKLHEIDYRGMLRVRRGCRKSYKGWTCQKP